MENEYAQMDDEGSMVLIDESLLIEGSGTFEYRPEMLQDDSDFKSYGLK